MDLKILREQIDEIDSQIVELFEKRMEISGEVAKFKIETGKQVYDPDREKEKIARVKSYTHSDINCYGVQELFELIMAISRKLQYRLLTEHEKTAGTSEENSFALKAPDRNASGDQTEKEVISPRVVFQGAEGAYSQAAMEKYFGKTVNSFHVDTFRDAMTAISQGKADFAVLPIENSTAGIVSEIYDLLTEFDNYIVGEQIIRIEHCLMAIPGTEMDEIETVYSHPQSLMQSAHFLGAHSWQQISMQNNAFAARKVAEDRIRSQAAIASEYAARLYGLQVLQRGVNDQACNSTRFIIVSGRKLERKDAGKISICFEVPHESGSLYRMLSHFIFNHLNMNRIESRPIEGKNWEYRFFIDFEGNLADDAVKDALRGLKEEANNLKILGNY